MKYFFVHTSVSDDVHFSWHWAANRQSVPFQDWACITLLAWCRHSPEYRAATQRLLNTPPASQRNPRQVRLPDQIAALCEEKIKEDSALGIQWNKAAFVVAGLAFGVTHAVLRSGGGAPELAASGQLTAHPPPLPTGETGEWQIRDDIPSQDAVQSPQSVRLRVHRALWDQAKHHAEECQMNLRFWLESQISLYAQLPSTVRHEAEDALFRPADPVYRSITLCGETRLTLQALVDSRQFGPSRSGIVMAILNHALRSPAPGG